VDENAGKSLSPAFLDRWVDKSTKDLFGSGYAGLGFQFENTILRKVSDFRKNVE